MKKVAVIIPTLNEEKTLGDLLDSLFENKYPNKEIIVVDGGSSDKTIDIAKRRGAIVLLESGKKENRCPANCWNRVARLTDADVLCFLGADFNVDKKNFFKDTMKYFDDEKIASVYVNFKAPSHTIIEKIMLKEGISHFPTFIRKDLFLKIGGFPLIGYCEDYVFTEKLKDFIKKNNLKEKNVVSTFVGGHTTHTLNELKKQSVWYGRSSIYFLREFSGLTFLKNLLKICYKPAYFLLFLSIFLLPFNNFFIFPLMMFFTIFFLIIIKNFKNHFAMLRSLLNIFVGFWMLYGIFIFLAGLDRRKGRG